MTKKNLAIAIAASLSLTGCGLFGDTFRDRSNDYQLAEEQAVIDVPEGMDAESLGEIYRIPSIADDTVIPNEFEVPRPGRASEVSFEDKIKLQSLDDKRWALVQASPAEVWPKIRNALSRNALPPALASASDGIMETVWVNFENDEEFSHRFRIKVEPGLQLNSTEVSVLHNQSLKGSESAQTWPESSNDPAREQEVLKLLAETLAGDVSDSTVSLLAQSIGGKPKVEVVTPNDAEPYILIKLSFERSWASVDYSAQRGEFKTVDKNRDEGIFYVQLKSEDEDGGWFSGWFGSNDEESRRVDYHILLKTVDQGVEVRIVNPDGSNPEEREALRLLKELRGNLS